MEGRCVSDIVSRYKYFKDDLPPSKYSLAPYIYDWCEFSEIFMLTIPLSYVWWFLQYVLAGVKVGEQKKRPAIVHQLKNLLKVLKLHTYSLISPVSTYTTCFNPKICVTRQPGNSKEGEQK